ncbi:hypothetical protein RND81_09G027000 [Saponaria officinalis]|uniref:Uncharacterized protein n=1 Tax=Saponaria officinalis TaxID=3572 RepID=A0AAW1IHP6_SAPOF
MGIVSGVSGAVSKRENLRWEKQHGGGRKVGWIFDSIGKYAIDFAVSDDCRGILHKTVEEEIRDQLPRKPCNNSEKTVSNSSEKKTQTKMDELPEEMSAVKHKTKASSEVTGTMSSNKLPPEQLKEKDFLLPNKRRIMIRSRL